MYFVAAVHVYVRILVQNEINVMSAVDNLQKDWLIKLFISTNLSTVERATPISTIISWSLRL